MDRRSDALIERWRLDHEERDRLIKTTGFVRIDDDLCEFLASHGPWVEIGAGTGALAAGITRAGGLCVATDNFSWGEFAVGNWPVPLDDDTLCSSTGVIRLEASEATRRLVLSSRDRARGLLSAWPS